MTALVVALLLAGAAASTALFAWLRSLRQSPDATFTPSPLLLLRPVAGDEPALPITLASSAAATALGTPRIRVLVASDSDTAAGPARRATDRLGTAGLDAACLVTGARGPNRKADQIARALAATPPAGDDEIVVVADADVELTEEVARDLGSGLAAGARIAWAAPLEGRGTTWGDATSAAVLGASLHAFSLLGQLDRAGLVGKCFAVRRRDLDAADCASLVTSLGEDMELARRLGQAAVVPTPCRSLAAGRSLRGVVGRYHRWLTVVRAQRPWLLASYPLLLASTPIALAFALVAPVAGASTEATLLAVLTVLLLRALVARLAAACARQKSPVGLPVCLLADALLLWAWTLSLVRRTVDWRGASLVVRGAQLEGEP